MNYKSETTMDGNTINVRSNIIVVDSMVYQSEVQ
jgi:hypothetical protein